MLGLFLATCLVHIVQCVCVTETTGGTLTPVPLTYHVLQHAKISTLGVELLLKHNVFVKWRKASFIP